MAIEFIPTICDCVCGDNDDDGCDKPIAASVEVSWEDPPLSYTDIIAPEVTGFTCGSLIAEGPSDEFGDYEWLIILDFFYTDEVAGIGSWSASVSSQTEFYNNLQFANQRTQDTPVTNPLDPTGTYYRLGGGSGDARPTIGTMTVTLLDDSETNAAPIITNIPTQINNIGDTISLQVSASDSDAGQTLSYSAVGLPSGLTIDSGTGLITGNMVGANVINELDIVTVTVTDDALSPKSASTTFGWFGLATS